MTARIYLRVSQEDERSIFENQREALLQAAGPAAMIYEDFGRSGADEDRPGIGKMLKEARSGDVIYFTSLSRMTRGGVGAALDILRQLEHMGVGWHFTEQPMLNYDSTTPKIVRDIMLTVFASIDEDYRERISRATKASFARRRALDPNWRGPGRPRKNALPRDDRRG